MAAATLVLVAFAIQPTQAASCCGANPVNADGLSKDDMSFNAASASDCYGGGNDGTWTIAFTNNGGQVPDLSHLSLYTWIDAEGGIPPIPEAQTYAMMLVGPGLVGFMARRRTRLPA